MAILLELSTNYTYKSTFLYFFQHIKRVLESPKFSKSVDDHDGGQIGHLFLVGGFAESAIVQEAIRSEFGYKMNVIIPQVRFRDQRI